MARTAKTEADSGIKTEAAKAPVTKVVSTDIPSGVDALLKLYPQYEEAYVTSDGFVHPGDSPEYIVKGATKYKNKYFNK